MRFLRLGLVVVFVLIAARLVDVQVFKSAQYQKSASEELTQPITVPALRGGIYDRDGHVLAMSVPTKTVLADDFQIEHPVAEAKALAPMLGMSPAQLTPLLRRHSGYVPLVKDLTVAKAAKIADRAFPGITLVDGSRREVPNGTLASPVLGLVNAAGKGAAGLEYQMTTLLAGQAGSETLLESPGGVALPGTPVTHKTAAVPGTGLELTLDEPLQYTTEQALAAEIVASHATSGVAMVMDTRTGQLLSMASLSANPTASADPTGTAGTPTGTGSTGGGQGGQAGQTVEIGPKGPVVESASNAAVTQLYEPGSVFKLVTFSAALQEGIISPNTTFTVPDRIQLDGSTFHDAETHPTERLSATQILAQSSNIGTAEIAQALGETKLLAQVKALGFGKPTGLHFPGESPGLIATATQWEPTNYVSLPIGQVDAVSALQVLDAYNAVANGGVFVAPKLVRATVGATGAVKATAPSRTHRVISASTDAQLVTMLQQVVQSGTGTSAFIPGYTVAGKTGTAQVPATGTAGYVPGDYMASFVGMAPAKNPVFTSIVVLDHPTPIFGGTVAAPVFSQIMTYALHHYDIPTTPGAATTPPPSGTVASTQTQDIT
ncbi:MAG TPA: penicillin-binding protein 2 [Acidimicrobiales bacterium]|nr:penicillin-binding protein 2 [Acidimicrobiales bacterium]